jgi:hypothetical protein
VSPKRPPLGVRLTADIEEVRAPRGTVWWARVRWHDPESGRRESITRSHSTHEAAATWITQLLNASRTGVDATQTLAEYVAFIGDRWTRGIDPTSTWYSVFCLVVRSWSGAAVAGCYRRWQECRLNTGPTRSDGTDHFGRAGEI